MTSWLFRSTTFFGGCVLCLASTIGRGRRRNHPGGLLCCAGGNDSNPGTAAAPFATLARARDAVRRQVAGGLTHDLLVLIRGGTYQQPRTLTFGPQDSATEKHSITYAAYPGEKVVVSGGRRISGWKKGNGEIWTTELPEVKAGKWYFRQLFVNDQPRGARERPKWMRRNPVAPSSNQAWSRARGIMRNGCRSPATCSSKKSP